MIQRIIVYLSGESGKLQVDNNPIYTHISFTSYIKKILYILTLLHERSPKLVFNDDSFGLRVL